MMLTLRWVMLVVHQVCGTPPTAADISGQSQGEAVGAGCLPPCLVPPATALALQCLLSGSWRSDTNCRMVVSTLDKDNRFSGFYLPGPASGYSELLTSPLEGSQQDTGLVPQPIFSFTVNWRLQGRQHWTTILQRGCQQDTG